MIATLWTTCLSLLHDTKNSSFTSNGSSEPFDDQAVAGRVHISPPSNFSSLNTGRVFHLENKLHLKLDFGLGRFSLDTQVRQKRNIQLSLLRASFDKAVFACNFSRTVTATLQVHITPKWQIKSFSLNLVQTEISFGTGLKNDELLLLNRF